MASLLAAAKCAIRAVAIAAAMAAAGPSSAASAPDEFSADEIARIVSHGPWPPPAQRDPTNRASGNAAAIALGQRLFGEPALSANGSVSCASCHDPARGFADGRPRAVGLAAHDRNTQGLLDVGGWRWFGWDGGADSLWAATMRPLLSPVEMGSQPARVAAHLRRDAAAMRVVPEVFGPDLDDESLAVAAAKSIAAWLETLQSPRTAFDAFRDALAAGDAAAAARYPAAARRGLKLFVGRGNCWICHVGPSFSNGEFHDVGRPFVAAPGRVDPGRHTGIRRHYSELDLDRLHADGENLLRPLKLDPRDIDDLVAFLESLSAAPHGTIAGTNGETRR